MDVYRSQFRDDRLWWIGRAEAPIVLTGAAIGSNLGRVFRMEQKTLMLLVGCGAAGAIAGIFKAPIAGLVFVIEVLMLDLTMTSVLPLLISSVTAATMSYILPVPRRCLSSLRPSIRDRAYSLRALAGCFLRIGIPLFYPCDEQGGRDVPEVGYVLEEVHVGRRDAEYLDILVPPAIW